MEAGQLKHILLDKLVSIEGKNLLEEVNKLIGDVNLEEKTFKVSPKQLEMLRSSESDIKNGKLISDEDLNEEEEKWLNE
ncbi:MAG: hypothetical protein ACR2KZ_09640 [Segetibacter sp.]